ncbi:MAG: rhomboid family intramembrane serine protease [Faecalibacterium prausnitzii]
MAQPAGAQIRPLRHPESDQHSGGRADPCAGHRAVCQPDRQCLAGTQPLFSLRGQIWRIITFAFIPSYGGSILSAVLGIYFTWFIGTALEREWGDFRYTVYLLSGMLGTVLACSAHRRDRQHLLPVPFAAAGLCHAVPGGAGAAVLCHPHPGEILWLFAAALWVLSFLGAPLPQKLSLLLSMANVWLFFGPMAYRSVRAWVRREQWKRRNRR